MSENAEETCSCGGRLRLNTIDDLATKWYRCEKCGQQQAVPGAIEEKLRLKQSRERYRHNLDDKPKTKNRCGLCAAFHIPFCPWEYINIEGEETKRALHVDANAYACSLYFPRPRFDNDKVFKKKVTEL